MVVRHVSISGHRHDVMIDDHRTNCIHKVFFIQLYIVLIGDMTGLFRSVRKVNDIIRNASTSKLMYLLKLAPYTKQKNLGIPNPRIPKFFISSLNQAQLSYELLSQTNDSLTNILLYF